MSNNVWHPQRFSEILECLIVSIVAKDCLLVVLSQYDLHHGSFLLVTPIIMSRKHHFQCKSTSLWWHAIFSKLCSKIFVKGKTFSEDNIWYECNVFSRSIQVLFLSYQLNIDWGRMK